MTVEDLTDRFKELTEATVTACTTGVKAVTTCLSWVAVKAATARDDARKNQAGGVAQDRPAPVFPERENLTVDTDPLVPDTMPDLATLPPAPAGMSQDVSDGHTGNTTGVPA